MSHSRPRHAKGQNLVLLVKMLRAARKAGQLADLDPQTARLLDERILITDWYPFENFEQLLRIAHGELLDGSDQAAQQMGELAASEMLLGIHKPFLSPGDPARTLTSLSRVWSRYFDFGDLVVYPMTTSARVTISGYEDMGPTHGNLLLGWARSSIVLSGAEILELEIDRAPWLGDSLFGAWGSWRVPERSQEPGAGS